MTLTVELATPAELDELTGWCYEPPYDFYDGDEDPVLNPERYFIARDEAGELVGFYYFELRGEILEYGLGLRPELAGKGLGGAFVEHGLELARARYRPNRIVLAVAAFNERAITVYERCGFRETGRHLRSFARWGDVEFVDMEEAR